MLRQSISCSPGAAASPDQSLSLGLSHNLRGLSLSLGLSLGLGLSLSLGLSHNPSYFGDLGGGFAWVVCPMRRGCVPDAPRLCA